jgi:hypothetical protein
MILDWSRPPRLTLNESGLGLDFGFTGFTGFREEGSKLSTLDVTTSSVISLR